MPKIQVTFSTGQLRLVRKLKGTIGETDSEVVRNIVVSYLSEKSYVKEEVMRNDLQEASQTRQMGHSRKI